MSNINRRRFLEMTSTMAAAGALGGLAGYSPAAHSAFGDYRALVCVFLFGGNDGFNMLVPRSDAEYNAYAASRQNLAVAQGDLLPIIPLTPDGVEYGLHPALGGLQTLFESGNAAFVANVGPLVEPTSKDQYRNGSVVVPSQLFSHNDQQAQWHSLKGNDQSKTGWAGRLADAIAPETGAQLFATNASLSGTTLFQSGAATVPYVMGPGGPLGFEGFADSGIGLEQRLAFERIIGARYDSVYERGFAEVQQRAVVTADLINGAIGGAPPLTTVFPASPLGQQLQTVAQLIAVRDQLQMERQVFFVGTGGFDTHDNQLQLQPGLLGNISDSINAFHAATVELGVADAVTTFSQSDFGRTLTSNGDGTDHAWGSVQLVVGERVVGQDIYGSYPLLEIGGPEDVGGGRMIPTTSADQYAATLATWMGVSGQDLPVIAPAIGNFGQQNLGFLA